MRRYIFLGLVLFMLTGFLSAPRQVRYVSAWTPLEAGETRPFPHMLNARPLVVEVWGAYAVTEAEKLDCQADFEIVFPAYETETLRLTAVTPDEILVSNRSDHLVCVQVIGVP